MKLTKHQILKTFSFTGFFTVTLFALLYGYQHLREDNLNKRKYVVVTEGEDILYYPRGKNTHWYTENTITGEKIHYHLDEHYTRITQHKPNHKANFHLILDGCSFVFGEGVTPEFTLKSILQSNLPKLSHYDFSFIGGSPHLSLHYHDVVHPEKFIDQKSGQYIYVFIPDQLARWHNTPLSLSWRDGNAPIYTKSKNRFVYTLKTKDLPNFEYYYFLRQLGLAQLLAQIIDSPMDRYVFSDEQLDSFVDSIVDLKSRYINSFPRGGFNFLFHPLGNNHDLSLRLINLLRKKDIETFYPQNDFLKEIEVDNFNADNFQIKYDGHPNEKMNRWLAEWIRLNIIKRDYRN